MGVQGSDELVMTKVGKGVLTSWPGQPIQVNCIVFLHPESAETRPPEDIYERGFHVSVEV